MTLIFCLNPARLSHAFPLTTARAARGLRNVEILGLKQDPYLRLRVGGQVFQTRVIIDGGGMASWNERFQIPIPTVSERCVYVSCGERQNSAVSHAECSDRSTSKPDASTFHETC